MFRQELSLTVSYLFVLASQLNLEKKLILEGISFAQLIDLDTLELFRDRFISFVNKIIEIIKNKF